MGVANLCRLHNLMKIIELAIDIIAHATPEMHSLILQNIALIR